MVENQITGIKTWFKNLSGNKTSLVFAIVPFLLFIYMLFRLAEINFFYQGWYDPVYAYLMNGLTFALGSNDIGHTDNPGTPLQLFSGLVISLVGFLRGTDDLATDVLTHPESYIRVIANFMIIINCLILWVLGLFSYKNLNDKNLAIVVQLLPLVSFELVKFLPIVACESVVTFSSLAIFACIILFDIKECGNKWLFIFIVFFSALSVSTKVSSIVILIVPFFFFEKFKTKAGYLFLSFLFIFLFISPVLDKMGNFVNFIKGIATHTGNYGSGEAKIIDWTIFFQSLQKMMMKEYTFTLHILLLPIGWVMIVKYKISGSIKRIYLAITLATLFQVFIVARHYSFHYLMPIFALAMPLHGYFWIRILKQKIGAVSIRIASLITIVLVIGVFTRLIIKNRFEKDLINPTEKTSQLLKNEFIGSYIILTENNNGGAFIEPAMRFGSGYSGSIIRKQYLEKLALLYPGNFLWNSHDGLTDWTGSYLPYEVFSLNNKIYLYARTGSCILSTLDISDMINQMGMSKFVKLRNIYQNERSGEVIEQAISDTASIRKYYQPRLVVETGMEEFAANGEDFKSNNEEYIFRGGKLQSNQIARNGKKSLLLTPSNPFGLNISIPISVGKRYKAEFWQRSSDQNQALVIASSSQSNMFYRSSIKSDNQKGEWTQSQLSLVLPSDYPEESINFYIWNPEADSVWIDDFSLKVFE